MMLVNTVVSTTGASTAAFSGAGQLRLVGDVLQAEVTGDNVADFELQLTGVSSLVTGDFYL